MKALRSSSSSAGVVLQPAWRRDLGLLLVVGGESAASAVAHEDDGGVTAFGTEEGDPGRHVQEQPLVDRVGVVVHPATGPRQYVEASLYQRHRDVVLGMVGARMHQVRRGRDHAPPAPVQHATRGDAILGDEVDDLHDQIRIFREVREEDAR